MLELSSFQANVHSIPLFSSAILTGSMGALVLSRDVRSPTNRYFFSLCFAIVVWLAATACGYLSATSEQAMFWFRLDNLGVMFISPLFFGFATNLVNRPRSRTTLAGIFIATIFGIANLYGYFSSETYHYYWGLFPKWKLLNSQPFFLFWFGYSLGSFLVLRTALRLSQDLNQKNQIKFVILGFAMAYFGSVDYLATFGVPVYPFGFIPIFLLVSTIFYAIVMHKLMDFNLIMRWGLAYSITAITVTLAALISAGLIRLFAAQIFHVDSALPVLLAACATVSIFEPLKRTITRLVDRFIFRSPDLRITVEKIETGLVGARSLDDVGELLTMVLDGLWGTQHVGIGIWDLGLGQFTVHPNSRFRTLPLATMGLTIRRDDFLIRTLETERRLFKLGVIYEDELTLLGNRASPGERITFWKIRRTMRWLGASACVPLMAGTSLNGLIAIGKKKNAFFTSEDKRLLSRIGEIVGIHVSSMEKHNDFHMGIHTESIIQDRGVA